MSYVALRNKNDSLNSLIGQSYNQKAKQEADNILKEIHKETQGRFIGKRALVAVTDNNEIKGIGGSTLLKNTKTGEIKSNLVVNNFGTMISGLLNTETASATVVGRLSETTNFSPNPGQVQNIVTYGNEPFNDNDTNPMGTFMRVGSGSTAPLVGDVDLTTYFGSGNESGNIVTGSTDFDEPSSTISKSGSITATGAGTVNELGMFCRCNRQSQANERYLWFHDLISPGQAFIATENIACSYLITM